MARTILSLTVIAAGLLGYWVTYRLGPMISMPPPQPQRL
jgi:hypothetical protein